MNSGKIRVRPIEPKSLEKGVCVLVKKDVDILGLETNIFELVVVHMTILDSFVDTDDKTWNIKDDMFYEFYILDEDDKTKYPLHQDYYDSYWRYYASRSYMQKCDDCKKEFLGAKMQYTCRDCLATHYQIEDGIAIPDMNENTRAGIFDHSVYTEEDVQEIIDYVKEKDPDPSQLIMKLMGKGFELKKKKEWNF